MSNTNNMENLESYHALRFNRDGLKELSNFHIKDFDFMGHTFHSSEAAFQSCKLIDGDDLRRFEEKAEIFVESTLAISKKLGRKVLLCSDWERVKAERMYAVITEKFKQNPGLVHILLNTDERFIIEDNTWHDNEWGVCECGACWNRKKAKNMLGLLLMKLRAELRDEQDCKVKYWLKGGIATECAGYIDLMDADDVQRVFKKHNVDNVNEFIKLMV